MMTFYIWFFCMLQLLAEVVQTNSHSNSSSILVIVIVWQCNITVGATVRVSAAKVTWSL